MKLKNIKILDEKIKKYEGIDKIFINNDNLEQLQTNLSNIKKEVAVKKNINNQSCNE